MFKKLLLILGLSLFAWMPSAQAELNFKHASVIAVCNNLEDVLLIFQTAQNEDPNFIALGIPKERCYRDSSFGGRIRAEVKVLLRQVSAFAIDWEGDPFAIFQYNDSNIFFLIYNPNDLLNQAVEEMHTI